MSSWAWKAEQLGPMPVPERQNCQTMRIASQLAQNSGRTTSQEADYPPLTKDRRGGSVPDVGRARQGIIG